MQLSTKGRYAVMAMVDLAARQADAHPEAPIPLAEIADRQQLSPSYLEQLFAKLRRANLLQSARGPGGGYRLARPAAQIAIADIVLAVDEPIKATRCEIGSGGCMLSAAPAPASALAPVPCAEKCQTHDLWFELGRQIALFLAGMTLEDVVAGRVCGRAVTIPPPQPPPTADHT